MVGVLLIVVGVACLWPGQPDQRPADHLRRGWRWPWDLVHQPAGHPASCTAPGRRAPVAVRLALRDLARYQARSGAALAAISLALGIAAAIMISSAADKTAAKQAICRTTRCRPGSARRQQPAVPIRTQGELGAQAAAVHQIAGSLGGAAVIPLDMPVNPASKPQPGGQQPIVSLNAPVDQAAGRGGVYRSAGPLRRHASRAPLLGINPAAIDPAANILTIQAGQDDLTTITTASRTPQTSSGSMFLTTAPNPPR